MAMPADGRFVRGALMFDAARAMLLASLDPELELKRAGDNTDARWSPDGNWVGFASEHDGETDIYKRRPDFSTPTERMLAKEGYQQPNSWSPDGKHLMFTETVPGARGESRNIWWVGLEGQGEPQPFVQSAFTEEEAVFLPDGGWGARWSPDGQELFYVLGKDRSNPGGKIMAVDVRTEPTFNAGTPYVLFEGPHVFRAGPDYDLAPDGERFVVLWRDEDANPLAGRENNIDTHALEGLYRLDPSE